MTRDEARAQGHQLLGDRIMALAEKARLAAVVRHVERVTGWRCGCARRTAALNAWDARRRG